MYQALEASMYKFLPSRGLRWSRAQPQLLYNFLPLSQTISMRYGCISYYISDC